jgi:hypothetical protein
MSAIEDPPNTYDYSTEFNYALWTPGSRIAMVNVPWNNDYRDIVKFASKAALNTYLDTLEGVGVIIENMSYLKPNQPIRINTPFNSAYRFNYIRVSNPIQPVPSDITRDYYYFVTDVRYVAPMTTEIVVQLDIWQTFGYDVTFGNSYIERGHIGIANENAFDNFGRDYLTIPEGLDYGNEYQVLTKRTEKIMEVDGNNGPTDKNNSVIVVSSVDLIADPGDVSNPTLIAADGSFFHNLPSGAAIYYWEGTTNFFAWLGSVKETPWVSQGIMSITMVPKLSRYMSVTGIDEIDPTPAPWSRMGMLRYSLFNNWRENSEILNKIPERYRHLTKFLTYPYMAIELTTFTGQPIVIKPEAWNDANATIVERATLVPPNQRVTFQPHRYNALTTNDVEDAFPIVPEGNPNYGGDDFGEYLDFMTQISNFPTFALINNGAIGYLASNANSIAFQRNSADWSQTRALRGNEVAYDQASGAIGATADSAKMNAWQDAALTVLGNNSRTTQGMINGFPGAVGGALHGNPMGAANYLAAAASNSVNVQANTEMSAVRQSNTKGQAGITNMQQGLVRDTNYDLNNWAARGDYENTIAGINAKVQDAQLIQPNVSGQMGGETLNIIANMFGVSIRWKMIDKSNITMIGEYWLRYGYAVKRFATIPASLMVMTKFTYWKCLETYITTATIPEFFKQAIRGIFEKGVTVWADPSYIGTIDIADNEPLEGITL